MNPSLYYVRPGCVAYRHAWQCRLWLEADGWLRRRFMKTYARRRLGTFRQLHPLGSVLSVRGIG